MNRNRSLGQSLLLLAAPLVASWNLDISSSSAAIITGYEVEEANTKEIIYERGASDISPPNINISDRDIFLKKDLLSIAVPDTDKKSPLLGDQMTSILGHLSVQINDVFVPNSETESTPVAPVNNVRSQSAKSQEINSLPPDEDPLKIFFKSIHFEEQLDTGKNPSQTPSYTDYTDRVEQVKINPSPVSEDATIKAPSENNSATAPTNAATQSSEPLNTTTMAELAQVPKVLPTKDPESFDIVPVAGGALGLGFLIWMLFQD
jgi:hypothetical protein